MAANVNPIYPLTPKVAWGKVLTANTAMDGTGTQVTVYTAGANGARVDKLRCKALGTNVQTVLRVFVNNGATNATPTNNTLIAKLTLPATAASNTDGTIDRVLLLDVALPATYVLNCAIGTTMATGWSITAEGGDY